MASVPKASRRAVIYTRISLDRKGDSAGVRRQKEDCRDLAKRQGWEVVAIEPEEPTSAYSGKRRPHFEAVLAHLREGRADTVVVWALDRLARRPRDLADVLELRREVANLAVVPVRGSAIYADDPSGRLTAEILVLVAQWESEWKAERVRRWRRQRAESGELPPRTYGYGKDGKPVEPAASAVRAAFDALLAPEHSVAAAHAALLQADPDAPASRNGTRTLLTRPAYAGLAQYQGAVRRDIETAWEPLIDTSTWERAQAILSRPSRRYAKHDRRVRSGLLTGLVTCGRCGEPMRLSTFAASKGRERYAVYVCDKGGDHLRRKARDLEAYVIAVVMARLGMPDAQSTVLPRPAEPGVDDLVSEYMDLRERRSEVADLFSARLMDRADYARTYGALTSDMEVLEEQIAVAQVDPESGAPLPADPAGALVQVGLGRMRTVVSALVEITAHPAGRGRQPFRAETVEIAWQQPLGEESSEGLSGDHYPPEEWWDEIQTRVDGDIGAMAEAWVEESAPPSLTADQLRLLWVALSPVAGTALDAEVED